MFVVKSRYIPLPSATITVLIIIMTVIKQARTEDGRETHYKHKKFWEELIASFPVIRQGAHRQRLLQQVFVAAGTELLLSNDRGIHRHPHTHEFNNYSIVA
jgi:hypothetical protein